MNKVLIVAMMMATLTGCASVFSKSEYAVVIASAPNESNFTIKNKKGELVHTGITPQTVTLRSYTGYFSGASYTVLFSKEGYPEKTFKLKSTVSGWLLGNVLIGGPIGLLIIDPLTGSMFNLPKRIDVALDEPVTNRLDHELTIASINSLTDFEKTQLVKIN